MSIREVAHYEAVCDQCGRESYPAQLERAWVERQVIDEGWTSNSGELVCDWCHAKAAEEACGSRHRGHRWGPLGDATIKLHNEDGSRYWMRRCRDCHRLEMLNEGDAAWHGWGARGNWLGTKETA